jgi:hypothetical protein
MTLIEVTAKAHSKRPSGLTIGFGMEGIISFVSNTEISTNAEYFSINKIKLQDNE